MTLTRILAVMLALPLLVGMAPELLPAALAEPSNDGCSKSPSGQHRWGPRTRDPWCETPGDVLYICGICYKEVFEETRLNKLPFLPVFV